MVIKKLLTSALMALCLVAGSDPCFSETPLPRAALASEFEQVQESFFHLAFDSFVADLSMRVPNLDLRALVAPAFDKTLSRNDWLALFSEHAVKFLAQATTLNAAEIARLRTAQEERFLSYHNNEGFARFAYLENFVPPTKTLKRELYRKEPLRLVAKYPEPHTLDVHSYVNERFPTELQEFVQAKRVALYLDDSNCDAAFLAQKREGFSRAVRFMGKLDNPESQYFFALNPRENRMRFVACDIRGRDARTRLSAILGPKFYGLPAFMVRHRQPAPLISFNVEGKSLKFNGTQDRVFIGFQNTVWWQLRNSSAHWTRKDISDGGTDVSLFFNSNTGERVISVANVYGDEMLQALDILYSRGLRRFIYLGTAGGLADDAHLGDILLPENFVEPDGKVLRFDNDAPADLSLPSNRKILRYRKQGWLATLIEETKPRMLAMKNSGVAALDIESRYFAKFFNAHPALEKMVIITISDQPLGHVNYNQQSTTRLIPMDSITRIIEQLFKQNSVHQPSRFF